MREKHSDIPLANLYKQKNFVLFSDLKKAHDDLNRVVMQAYGLSVKDTTESSCVAELMRRYQALTQK